MTSPTIEDFDDKIKNKEEISAPASLDLDYKLKDVDQSTSDVESAEKRHSSNVYSIIASGAALIS